MLGHRKQIRALRCTIEQQRSEIARLSESEAILTSALSSVAGIHWWKDREGVYAGVNQAMLDALGLQSRDEIIGKTDEALPWSTFAQTLRRHDQTVLDSGKAQGPMEEQVRLVNGSTHTFLVTKAPLRNAQQEVIGTVGNSMDITELKRLQLELEHANQVKDEFIANMSHDIRTPITGMLGLIESIKQRSLDPCIQEEAGLLRQTTEALLNLLNEILDLIALEREASPCPTERFSLREMMAQNVSRFASTVNVQRIALKVSIDETLPDEYKGHRVYLDRIIFNLLSNALKFTHQGEVHVCLQKSADCALELQITDTGVGIPPDQLEAIFDDFSRLSPSYKGVYEGYGLGLYKVKKCVEKLGGLVRVRSEIGQGSIFRVRIPLKRYPPGKPLPLNESEEGSDKAEPLYGLFVQDFRAAQVLLVESSELVANAIAHILAQLNCCVDVANTAEIGVDRVMKHEYDFVCLDMDMPEQANQLLVQRIRQLNHPTKAHTPIIGLTQAVNQAPTVQCKNAGIQAIYPKPLTFDLAKQIVQKYVSKLQN